MVPAVPLEFTNIPARRSHPLIVHDEGGQVGIDAWNAKDVEIYNNTVYNIGGDAAAGYCIRIHFAHNAIVKNNICHTATTHLIFDDESDTPTVDNNLYFPDGATAFKWDVTTSNFADWKTNSGHDANSPTPADPLFVDKDNADFLLQSGSPAIEAGIDVGLTQDFAGVTVPHGATPDIGALESGATSIAPLINFLDLTTIDAVML